LQAFWPLQACLAGAAAESAVAGAAADADGAADGDAAGGVSPPPHPVAPTKIPPMAAAINECETFMMTSREIDVYGAARVSRTAFPVRSRSDSVSWALACERREGVLSARPSQSLSLGVVMARRSEASSARSSKTTLP
jgi:hypothetical protein